MWHLTYVYWDVIILPFDLWQLYYFVIANQPVTCWRQLAEVQNEHQNGGWGGTEQSLTWWHVEVRMGRERQQGVKWPPITAKICRVASLNTQHLQSCGSIYHLHCIFICLSRLLLSAPFINSNQRIFFFWGGNLSCHTLSFTFIHIHVELEISPLVVFYKSHDHPVAGVCFLFAWCACRGINNSWGATESLFARDAACWACTQQLLNLSSS